MSYVTAQLCLWDGERIINLYFNYITEIIFSIVINQNKIAISCALTNEFESHILIPLNNYLC